MRLTKNKLKTIIIGILVIAIGFIHLITWQHQYQYYFVYRELYFIPLIMAAFWFGLRGALITSLLITAFYISFTLVPLRGFIPDKFDTIMEILLLNGMAIVLGILRDRERIERQRSEKAEMLAAIGKAISAVAHDMKTPLMAIGGFSRQLLKKLGESDPNREKLSIILQEAQRMENMVKDMLDFARPVDLQLAREDVNKLMRDSLIIVQGVAQKKGVQIETHLSPDIPQVDFDAFRMKQVVINLLLNAIEASPEAESVIVRTSHEEGNIIIDVIDHGHGIAADQKENIFTPFFTTKKEGVGLGLAIVKNIVAAHKGHVKYSNNPNKGVTFRVILPE
jgi:two-component system, NtrC family, sensor histidine kinase HydH